MSPPPIPPLSAMRVAAQEVRGSTSVQVLGMDVAQSQPLVRNPSGASDSSLASGATAPHQLGDYAATRTYIPSHRYTSRLQNQSSFSTATSQSPVSSEAHEELASIPSRSANQYESSTLRLANAPESSSRRSQFNHGNRILSHKDSFGGSYAINAGIDLGSESADEAPSFSRTTPSQRPSDAQVDDRSYDSHHRNISLSRPAHHAHNRLALSTHRRRADTSGAQGSEASDLTEPVEVLGRPSACTDLPHSERQQARSPSHGNLHALSALSAAAKAASNHGGQDPAQDPADTTFATSFDRALAHNLTEQDPSMTTRSPSAQQGRMLKAYADPSSSDRDSLDLPEYNTIKRSPASSSTPLASKASGHDADDSITPSASIRDLRQPAPSSSAVGPEASSRDKDRREKSDQDKASASTSRKPTSRSSREPATVSSLAHADPSSSAPRPLKTSHRTLPQLPSASSVKPAPPPAMYWSKAPVHGSVPRRSFRAHTANLCDEVLWLFGGCDNRGCFRDLWCFDTETMCWSKPKVTGDMPPARRAHSATMVNKRLFVFAGGDGPHYFNDLYVFDTVSLRWSKPEVGGTAPSPRRAHTCNYYEGQLIVFGGGNGVGALNDVHTLDVSDLSRLEWRKMDCRGKVPIGRGYHTSNLVDGKLIVIGGSDGHMSFNDIHILRLDTQTWYQVKTDEIHNRLGHTATQVGSYLFIFGGHDSKTYTSELLTLNLVNLQWEPRKVCGKKPQGRGYHQAWLRDSRLFVHGGFDGKDIFDDLHFLDLAACAYLPQITSFSVELDDEE